MARGDLSVANDQEIHDRLTCVEEIIEQLDADECDLEEGGRFHEEGQNSWPRCAKFLITDVERSWNPSRVPYQS